MVTSIIANIPRHPRNFEPLPKIEPGYFPLRKLRELTQMYVSDRELAEMLLSGIQNAQVALVANPAPGIEEYDKQLLEGLSDEQIRSLLSLRSAMAGVPHSERMPPVIMRAPINPGGSSGKEYVEEQTKSPEQKAKEEDERRKREVEREAREKAEREAQEKAERERDEREKAELEKTGSISIQLNGVMVNVTKETAAQITVGTDGIKSLAAVVEALEYLINGEWYDRLWKRPVPFAVKLDKQGADKVGNLFSKLIPDVWGAILTVFGFLIPPKVMLIVGIVISVVKTYGLWILDTNTKCGSGVRLEYWGVIGVVFVFGGNYEELS